MRYENIAKDFYYETTASTLSYYITCDGDTIYTGISVKADDEPNNRVNIRRRVADYLDVYMPDFRAYNGVVVPHPEQLRFFELYTSDGVLLETYGVVLGCNGWDGGTEILSDPINGKADPRQKIMYGLIVGDVPPPEPPEPPTPPEPETFSGLTFEITGNGIIRLAPSHSFSATGKTADIEYSKDSGVTWNKLEATSGNPAVLQVSSGDTIYWKNFNQDSDMYFGFSGSTAPFKAYGDLSSVDPENSSTKIYSGQNSTILKGFLAGSSVVDAEGIVFYNPKRYLSNYRGGGYYDYFFGECESLVKAPATLPSVLKSHCYFGMFYYCPSLTTTPTLSATILFGAEGCYSDMFKYCSSITTAPQLPAYSLSNECYKGMFAYCTALTKAPDLMATVVPDEAYSGMFQGCTSLVNAPLINANRVDNEGCSMMFYGCTALKNEPMLNALTLGYQSYAYMFANCSSLEIAPSLPASPVPEGAYYSMFQGCTSLVGAPELLADGVSGEAYSYMFDGCSELSYIVCLAGSMVQGATNGWLRGVSQTGTFVKRAGQYWDRSANGIPSGWTVEEA